MPRLSSPLSFSARTPPATSPTWPFCSIAVKALSSAISFSGWPDGFGSRSLRNRPRSRMILRWCTTADSSLCGKNRKRGGTSRGPNNGG